MPSKRVATRKEEETEVETRYDPEPYYKLLDLHFKPKDAMTRFLIASFDHFMTENIPRILQSRSNIFSEEIVEGAIVKTRFEFSNFTITPPCTYPDRNVIYPLEACTRRSDYSATYMADVRQMEDTIQIGSGTTTTRQIGETEKNLPIAKIPIMVGSRFCNLNLRPDPSAHHSRFESGGYFIINGSEKFLATAQAMVSRKPLVMYKKEQSKSYHTVTVDSRAADDPVGPFQKFVIYWKSGRPLITLNNFKEMSVFTLIRALGLERDGEICRLICNIEREPAMMNMIMTAMHADKEEKNLTTAAEAMASMLSDMSYTRKYSSADPDLRQAQREQHLRTVLSRDILPHVTSATGDARLDMLYKARFICYCLRCLLLGIIKSTPENPKKGCDDRDSLINKRMEAAGALLTGLFESFFRKLINICKRSYSANKSKNNPTPNVIRVIRPNIIGQGIRLALSTGNFTHVRKVGVSQSLNRSNHPNAESYKRRIVTHTSDKVKLTSIRQLHLTSTGSICPLETPNGPKAGMTRALAMLASITVPLYSMIPILRRILAGYITPLDDVDIGLVHSHVKVFLDGCWMGTTEKAVELLAHLRALRFRGEIDKHVGFSMDYSVRELYVLTEGGRFVRPYLVVEDDRLLFRPEMLEGVRTWEEFLLKHPGVIEYLDKDEEMQMMLATFPRDLEKNLTILNRKAPTGAKAVDQIDRVNRYDGWVYQHYTHCEIHPATIFGVLACNIPHANHNPTTRGIFQCSQMRNAMGVSSADWRYRLDISYLLSHPEVPLISTRLSSYTGTTTLPIGQNVIVAVMSYTGFNQEDSIVINRSAIAHGLFRAHSLKKYISTSERSKTTARTQTFTKPDPSRVDGMRRGSNYDKLNEAGYVPEETPIKEGDVIIGLVEPRGDVGRGDAPFRDHSMVYKNNVPGTVDKVIIGQDDRNYKIVSMRIRTERVPVVGDKFASTAGQKGTMGAKLHACDMPFLASGITPDLIINPNCLPTRMTIGQLIEMLQGKACAVEGILGDATPFTGNGDIRRINRTLKRLGVREWGKEDVYCGYTGIKNTVPVFVGCTYYLRLKQMVDDKMHAHAVGQKQVLTHQPQEGRAKNGGMRMGEMERDSIIAHGCSQTLREKMMELSDVWTGRICDICGTFAWRSPVDRQYRCASCDTQLVTQVILPYPCKLLIQELESAGIMARLRTSKSIALPKVTVY